MTTVSAYALVAAVVGILPAGASAQQEPASLVRGLESAVDRGRADSARAAWTRTSSTRPQDAAPRFALATLDRLQYRRARAQAGFASLVRLPGAGPGWRAASRLSLGRILVGSGDSAGAGYLRAAVATADSAGPAASGIAAAAMLDLARTVARTGALDSARRLIERARALAPAADTSLAALAECSFGGTLVSVAPPRADSLITQGITLAERAGDDRALARCLLARYQALMARGLPAQAVQPLADALTAVERTGDAEAAATVNQLRAFHYIQFSYGVGNGRRHALAAIRLGHQSGNRLAAAYAHLNLAQLAIRIGDFPAAGRRRDSAVALLSAIGDLQGQAAAEFVAGDAAFALGDVAAAGRAYRAVLDLHRRLRLPVAGINQRLALVAIETRDYAGARRLLDETAAEAERVGNKGFLADKVYYDALLALREGRALEAAAGFRRYRQALHPGAFQYLLDAGTREAESLALGGKLEEAAGVLDSALAGIEQVRGRVSDPGDNRNRDILLAIASNRRFEFDPDLGLATIVASFARAGRLDAAFRFAEAERARLLWVRTARRAVLRDSTVGPSARTLVPRDLPMVELARALGDDTALLAYSTGAGGEPTTVLVLDHRGLRAFAAPPADSLAGGIQRFAALAAAGTLPGTLGRSLAAQLLDRPLASLPAGIRRLIVIPDGPLHRLPFDALPQADGSPVLARYEVALMPSARLAGEWLGRAPATDRNAAAVIAFGDPRFASATALPRLRGSGVEARLATAEGRRGVSYLRAAATEAAFHGLDSVPASIIHLATHARTVDAGVLASAVFLAPGGGHDGRVGPEEIAGRHLSVDLVMLTGCRTTGGALTFGEGVQGLVVPFLEAGARSVIATLWDVGDERIVPLVRRFYQNLERGADAGAALRSARLAGWRSGESPAVWAGLTLTGDPRVRPLATTTPP